MLIPLVQDTSIHGTFPSHLFDSTQTGRVRLTNLTETPSLALELASWNPLNRLGHSEELRGVIMWLAGRGASYVTGSK